MVIKNGLVYTAKGIFEQENILIQGEKIISINQDSDSSDDVYDAQGLHVLPGLIDIHLHGCVGADFCTADKNDLDKITEYQLQNGITSIVPTSMTIDENKLEEVFNLLANYESNGARIVGINMEGPFISEEKKGAQNSVYIKSCNVNLFNRLQKVASGKIKLVDIAPELTGAYDFIKKVSESVHVSLAHTACDYETAMEAFELGADHVTHLYNGMNGFEARNPGLVAAASDSEHVFVELIADGVHSAPASVRMAVKFIGVDRLIFISDSMEATGMPDGQYMLGGQDVSKIGNKAVIAGSDIIAGSVSNLWDIVVNAVKNINIPLETAIKCVTINPAKSIGIDGEYGSIEAGKIADIVICNKNLEVVNVIKDGIVVV